MTRRLVTLAFACAALAACGASGAGPSDGGDAGLAANDAGCAGTADCQFAWQQQCAAGFPGEACESSCGACPDGTWSCASRGCSRGGCPLLADGGGYTWSLTSDCPFDAGAPPF